MTSLLLAVVLNNLISFTVQSFQSSIRNLLRLSIYVLSQKAPLILGNILRQSIERMRSPLAARETGRPASGGERACPHYTPTECVEIKLITKLQTLSEGRALCTEGTANSRSLLFRRGANNVGHGTSTGMETRETPELEALVASQQTTKRAQRRRSSAHVHRKTVQRQQRTTNGPAAPSRREVKGVPFLVVCVSLTGRRALLRRYALVAFSYSLQLALATGGSLSVHHELECSGISTCS